MVDDDEDEEGKPNMDFNAFERQKKLSDYNIDLCVLMDIPDFIPIRTNICIIC